MKGSVTCAPAIQRAGYGHGTLRCRGREQVKFRSQQACARRTRPGGWPRLALAAVGLATFMTSLDQYVRQSMTATPQVSGYRGATGMVRSNQVDRAAPAVPGVA